MTDTSQPGHDRDSGSGAGPNPRHDLSGFEMQMQESDTTCGPTCLHAIYRYFGETLSMEQLLAELHEFDGGGTLGVMLATDALTRGYRARIVTWNLQIFDPTWYSLDRDALRERLLLREAAVGDEKLAFACRAYVEFLDAGGLIEFRDLESALLRRFLRKDLPVLTGLSATFLYRESRERPNDNVADDIAGSPSGHFVVLTDYDPETHEVIVSDPLHPNPLAEVHTYRVGMEHLIGAIYLGVLTYDANLIVIEPLESESEDKRGASHRRSQ